MWNTNSGSGSSGEKKQFIHECGIDFLVIPNEKLRVSFLTEIVDVEQIMSLKQMTREQATEHIYTVMAEEKWINPKAYWEHSVPSIPGQRFYSTIPCQGRNSNCKCCNENEASGAEDNKLKPFPVRKKFLIPVWVYSMNKVLYIRQNEEFINAIGEYINQNGVIIDFDIWRTGKGFSTKYHSMYIGPRQTDLTSVQVPPPNKVILYMDTTEINKRINGSPKNSTPPAQQNQPAQPAQQNSQPFNEYKAPEQQPQQPQQSGVIEPSAGQYIMPFGNFKGQTLEALYQAGEIDYLKFNRDQGAGLVKDKVTAFLAEKGV